MILTIILIVIALLLLAFGIAAISVGGFVAVLSFGDVFVCIGIIVFLICRIIKKKRKK